MKANKKDILNSIKQTSSNIYLNTISPLPNKIRENYKNTNKPILYKNKTKCDFNIYQKPLDSKSNYLTINTNTTKNEQEITIEANYNNNLTNTYFNEITNSLDNKNLNAKELLVKKSFKNTFANSEKAIKNKISINKHMPNVNSVLNTNTNINQTPKNNKDIKINYNNINIFNENLFGEKKANESNNNYKTNSNNKPSLTGISSFRNFIKNSEKPQIRLDSFSSRFSTKNFELNSEELNTKAQKHLMSIETTKSKDAYKVPFLTTLGINLNDMSDLSDEVEFENANVVLNTINTNLELIKKQKLNDKLLYTQSIDACHSANGKNYSSKIFCKDSKINNATSSGDFQVNTLENKKISLNKQNLNMNLINIKPDTHLNTKAKAIPFVLNKGVIKNISTAVNNNNCHKNKEIENSIKRNNFSNKCNVNLNDKEKRCASARVTFVSESKNLFLPQRENKIKKIISSEKPINKETINDNIPITPKAHRFYLLMKNKNRTKNISSNINQANKMNNKIKYEKQINFGMNKNLKIGNKNLHNNYLSNKVKYDNENKEDSYYLLSKNDFYYEQI